MPIDIHDWFEDGRRYLFPDGTVVQAVLVEQDGICWSLVNVNGQPLIEFLYDGRVRSYVRERLPHYLSANRDTKGAASIATAYPKDVCDWFVDGKQYLLPDGTPVQAVLVEREDEFRWTLRDMDGLVLFAFMEDGRARAYVQERIPYYSNLKRCMDEYVSTWMVPCDLTIDDLRPGEHMKGQPSGAG